MVWGVLLWVCCSWTPWALWSSCPSAARIAETLAWQGQMATPGAPLMSHLVAWVGGLGGCH